MKCPYCGSERIEVGVSWGISAASGNVGLTFSVGKMLKVAGVAQAYSDLCLDCKSIIKTYIKEDTDKNWVHRPRSLGGK